MSDKLRQPIRDLGRFSRLAVVFIPAKVKRPRHGLTRAKGLTTSNGVRPVTEADANSTPTWLSRREAVDRVACHLGYPTENAWLRIIRYGRAGRIKARGRVAEGWAISLLSDAWREGPGEVTNLELLLDDLIEADLLPAPGRPEGAGGADVVVGRPSACVCHRGLSDRVGGLDP